METLFEYASEYAKGYADVGYDEDQIASVRDAFLDGAKWQKNHVWHKPSEEPANGCRIIIVEKLADNSICHDIGYYNKARNIVACELHDVWLEYCQQWAYIEDLVKATLTDF